MAFVKRIHPSAVLFAGILVAFTLPFGYSAEACGASTAEYRGVDVLVANVEPDGETIEAREYASAVAVRGVVFGWALFAAAAVGLWATVFRGGRWWATWCGITAFLALVFGFVVINAGGPSSGWVLTLSFGVGGVVLKIVIAIVSWIARRLRATRAIEPAVTTPGEPPVR